MIPSCSNNAPVEPLFLGLLLGTKIVSLRSSQRHCGDKLGTLKDYQRYAARCLEQARADPDSKHRLFLMEMAEAWRRLAEKANANAGYTETPISESDRGD
jgi:hypothetical protein